MPVQTLLDLIAAGDLMPRDRADDHWLRVVACFAAPGGNWNAPFVRCVCRAPPPGGGGGGGRGGGGGNNRDSIKRKQRHQQQPQRNTDNRSSGHSESRKYVRR